MHLSSTAFFVLKDLYDHNEDWNTTWRKSDFGKTYSKSLLKFIFGLFNQKYNFTTHQGENLYI